MNKFTKLNARYKYKQKKTKISTKRLKKIITRKNLTPSFCSKIIVIFFLIFLLNSFNFNKVYFDKNYRRYEKYEKNFSDNSNCQLLDPINIFDLRLKKTRFEICNENNTKHICYVKNKGNFNTIFTNKNGVICTIENIVLDPSKLIKTNFVYNGPVDGKNKGFPVLSKGFINTKCTPKEINVTYNKIYKSYFNSWNYDYNMENENETLDELAPGKTVFLMGRNQDSPNLFHGNSEIVNIICMLYLFNLAPEEVKILIFEGIEIPEDPFYEIYQNLFSSEPIYVKNLKKKYKISKAINVPMNWDSPVFINVNLPKCTSTVRTYQLYNDFVDKYMKLKPFKDTFISDNISYYYPKETLKNHEKGIKFIKNITIQWRKVWPSSRKGQVRLLGNAIELTNKLAQVLPNNFLIRLINTAALPYKDQISLMRSTDYLLGIHGAGLSLSIFLPKNSILHEIYKRKVNNLLITMSALSGHPTYSDLIKSKSYSENGNEYVVFDQDKLAKKVLGHMKKNNYF